MIAQGAGGMINFNQPTTKPKRIDRTHHDAGGTTVATVVVHLEQMSSGWHERHDGVLVHGCLGDLGGFISNGWTLGVIPSEKYGRVDTPSFPLEYRECEQGSEDERRRMTHRRRHWKICRM
jgi:hypothetical protein